MSDSGEDDDNAGIQAQVAQMLGPMNKKLKKALKAVETVEANLKDLKKVGDEVVPAVRKEMSAAASEWAVKLERVQSEVA